MTPYGRSARLMGGPDNTGEHLALFRSDAYADLLQLPALRQLSLNHADTARCTVHAAVLFSIAIATRLALNACLVVLGALDRITLAFDWPCPMPQLAHSMVCTNQRL